MRIHDYRPMISDMWWPPNLAASDGSLAVASFMDFPVKSSDPSLERERLIVGLYLL